jgi:mannose/cellobiose epimerase-like protein (N-acyl-D-glucosamine 2-epimerase family)
MRIRHGLFYVLYFVIGLSLSCGPIENDPAAIESFQEAALKVEKRPVISGHVWQKHLKEDLLPFWMMKEALGNPVGNFPTFRDNTGKVYDPNNPAPELANADAWISDNLDKDYVRMKSRQTYAYGVAYHMTGEPRYLELAKAGVDFIRRHAIEPSGSIVSYFVDGQPDQLGLERTSQSIAYGLLGLGFYYYLTRDDAVLRDILKVKDFLFTHYIKTFTNPVTGESYESMAWAVEGEESGVQDLVVPLDQINAYLLGITAVLPEPIKSEWIADMRWLTGVILEQHYNADFNIFRGVLSDDPNPTTDTAHTDFGHSIKTFWMLYFLGRLFDDPGLVDFARENGSKMLDWAFIEEKGAWSQYPILGTNEVSQNQEWWSYAELNQFTATMGIHDSSYLRYLTATYSFWMDKFVDKTYGEVHHYIMPDGDTSRYPKVHLWKNAFHSFEHALIGYITSQAIKKKPVVLYFALEPCKKAPVVPYYYKGKEILRIVTPQRARNVAMKYMKTKVIFTHIQ